MTKKMVEYEIENFYFNFGRPIQEIIEKLQKVKEKHGEGVTIKSIPEPYSRDNDYYYAVIGMREETDAEYRARLSQEAEYAKNQAEWYRRTFERLKIELGENS